MPLTVLTAQALIEPEKCIELIMAEGKECKFETRPLAKRLGVSYPTLLRVLYRLKIRRLVRDKWKATRKENKNARRQ